MGCEAMTRMRRWSQWASRSRLLPARWRVCHIWSASLALCNGAVRQLTSLRPLHLPSRKRMLIWPPTWPPSSWASLIRPALNSSQK